jgi:hypothetical protein
VSSASSDGLDGPDQQSALSRLLISACAVGTCAVLFGTSHLGALPWNGGYTLTGRTLTILGLIAALAASLPWLDARRRSPVLLVGSVVVGAFITRFLIVVPLLFAWLVIKVSRTSWPTWLKLLLLLGTWAAVAVLKWVAPRSIHLPYGTLAMYWACLPAAVICLVVERARGQLEGTSRTDEWGYLLAVPRFFLPFLQPIRASTFVASRAALTPRLALMGLGLGLLAALCLLGIKHLHYSVKSPGERVGLALDGPWVIKNMFLIYCINASRIFVAVALLRHLGYALGSGFRFPLLATSFNDLYRRWNYFYYEYVGSILYLPLVNWLRRAMPLSLAYVLAGYPSIVLGAWALDNVFFQFPIGRSPDALWQQISNWQELLGYLLVWSFIILPQALFGRFVRRLSVGWRRTLGRVFVLGFSLGICVLLYFSRVAVY